MSSLLFLCEKVDSDLAVGGGLRQVYAISSTTYNWLVTIEIKYSREGDNN